MPRLFVWLTVLLSCLGAAAHAAPQPAFDFESLLNISFDDESGTISFTEYDLVFAPDGQLNAAVAVTDANGKVIQSFQFFPDYRWREGVFARASVKGPADVTLTQPGVYNIIFVVNGEMATRLAVALEQTSEGDDPFNPVKTYRFYGLWQVYAYLTMRKWGEGNYPQLTFWVGGRDLAEDTDRDQFFVTLARDGEVLGHSKRTQGHIGEGHYKRVDADIYLPHERTREANAMLVPTDEWTKDGEYVLTVTRKSDGAVIRRYGYTAQDGKIRPLEKTKLGFEPRIDYMVPRVQDRNTQQYDFEEAIWIKSVDSP